MSARPTNGASARSWGEDSPLNSVGARLAAYAVLAGAAAGGVALALRHRRLREAMALGGPEELPSGDRPA